MTTDLKSKLKKLRDDKGYSLDKLAELTKTSKSYLWELENRDTRKPSAKKLSIIAKELGVTTDYLLNDSDTPNDDVIVESVSNQYPAFFRNFSKLEKEDQEKINDIVDMWSKKE